jgi:hypothetical protein
LRLFLIRVKGEAILSARMDRCLIRNWGSPAYDGHVDFKCPVSTQIPGRGVIVSTGQLHDSLGGEMIADDAAGHATVSFRI